MISCSQHLAWNPISNDGSEADGDREAQPDTAMTFHPTVEKGIERAASYLSRQVRHFVVCQPLLAPWEINRQEKRVIATAAAKAVAKTR